MSTLDRLLERRRGNESPRAECCHSLDAEPSSLVVETPGGESWVFPWAHLTSACLSRSGDRDEMRLTFTSHEVTLRGLHLAALRDLVATVRLATIRPAPTKFARAAADQPFIDVVTVRALQATAEAER